MIAVFLHLTILTSDKIQYLLLLHLMILTIRENFVVAVFLHLMILTTDKIQ